MKGKNTFIISSILIGILLLLSVFSHLSWIYPYSILTNGDVWFLYKEGMRTANWGTWTSVLSLGEVNVSYNLFLLTLVWQGVSSLGFDYQVANQIVYFFIIIFITPIAVFAFLRSLAINAIASFIATVVYMYTSFFLMMQNGGLLLAVAYSILPLQFLFLNRYLEKQKIKDGLCFVLILSVAILYELRIVYISLFVFVFYIIFFFIQKYKRDFIKKLFLFILKSIPLIIVLLIINSYIYLPLLLSSIQDSATIVATRGLFGASFFTLANPLVLMHPFWTGTVPSEFIPQPIPFYFWIFPIFAFSAVFFARQNKKILFFAVTSLIMVFMGKSAADPLGGIYEWLYFNFPGFGFFREPSKFWAMMAFSYTVLIGYTIHYIYLWIEKEKRLKRIQSILKILVILPVFIGALYIGKPAFTSQLGPLFNHLPIPEDHYYIKDFLYDQKSFFRTFYVPGRYRMGFWSEIHPMLGLNEVPEHFKTLNEEILSLLSIKYVIVPPDITKDVYRTWGNKSLYEESVAKSKSLKRLLDSKFNSFVVYENTNEYKPHIYSASKLNYISGDRSLITRIFPLIDEKDSTIYFENSDYSQLGKERVDEMNKKQYDNSNTVFLSSTCIRCESKNYLEGLVYPYAKILPDSPLYFFIRQKEQKELAFLENNRVLHLQSIIVQSTKRVFEIQRITEKKLGQSILNSAIREYKKSLGIVASDLNSINKSVLSNDQLINMSDYIDVQLTYTSQLLSNSEINSKNKELLKENYINLLTISQKIGKDTWISDAENDRYILNVAYPETYDVFIEGIPVDQSSLTINGEKLMITPSNIAGWSTVGSHPLVKGENKIVLSGRKTNHVNETSYIEEIPRGIGTKKITIPINNIEGNKEYIVSFFYKITDKSKVQSYIERNSDYDQNGFSSKSLDGFLSADENWHEYRANFSSRFGESDDLLTFQIYKDNNKPIEIELRDISVVKNNGSLLIFKRKKQVDNVLSNVDPKITFQWINPTKYKVNIENAQAPFYLVFSENYSNGWDAYIKKEKNTISGKVVKNFKNEDVIEIEPKNKIDLFSGFAGISGEKNLDHIEVNSFANAWYIEKTGSYGIDIEFMPQRIFSLSLVISIIGVIISIVWLLFLIVKKF